MQILVVDDSKAMRMIVLRTLKQSGIKGFSALEASNGQEAWDLICAEDPELVLCDWNMPVMSGIELLHKLRLDKKIRLFGFVTSQGCAATKNEAFAAGAAFIITKPFTPQSFERALMPLLASC